MIEQPSKNVILASASKSRATMLKNAGLDVDTIPADIDEEAVRTAMEGSTPADIAEVLARLKAEAVSRPNTGSIVIGADQILALGDEIFEKPADMDGARRTLLKLKGKTHELISAVALAKNGETIWTHVQTAELKMRDLSPEFIGRYMAAAGDPILSSVGAYQLEGLGVQLFEEIHGDFFTILGLPLVPLLEKLRQEEIIS